MKSFIINSLIYVGIIIALCLIFKGVIWVFSTPITILIGAFLLAKFLPWKNWR